MIERKVIFLLTLLGFCQYCSMDNRSSISTHFELYDFAAHFEGSLAWLPRALLGTVANPLTAFTESRYF